MRSTGRSSSNPMVSNCFSNTLTLARVLRTSQTCRTASLQIPTSDECVAGLRPPKDFPICGFLGESCIEKDKDHVGLIVSVVLAVILICVIVIGLLVFRKFKEEAEIARMNWKIDPNEIMTSRGGERGRYSF